MTASHRRILRWVPGVMAGVIALLAILVVTVAAQINGGWDEVFDRSHPRPDDPEVAGWVRTATDGLPGTLRYWDQFAGPFPGSPSGDDLYGPDDLPSAGYSSADGRFGLSLGFDGFPLFTGHRAPELADDEYAVMVTVSHSSFLE